MRKLAMKRETTTMVLIMVAALAAAAILSSVGVLIPQASAGANPCEQIGHFKSNPNCFNNPLCASPCPPQFEPGLAGKKS